MKKTLCALLVIFLFSCGTTKIVKKSEKTLKGNWTLDKVSSSVIGELKITLFGNTSRKCLKGSSWEFIPNNNTGSYTENGMDCNLDKSYFVFSIDEVDETSGFYDFLLKPTDEKGKSATDKGYRLELLSLTESTMAWKHTIDFEGKPMTLTFNFTKQ